MLVQEASCFRMVASLHSDYIRQVSLYYRNADWCYFYIEILAKHIRVILRMVSISSLNSCTFVMDCWSVKYMQFQLHGTYCAWPSIVHVLCSGISPPTERPVASSLSCNSYSNSNGRVSYGCVFSTTARCSPSEYAAVECSECDAPSLLYFLIQCIPIGYGAIL